MYGYGGGGNYIGDPSPPMDPNMYGGMQPGMYGPSPYYSASTPIYTPTTESAQGT
jgi:hypothetical protein